jgi:hypothetical protein
LYKRAGTAVACALAFGGLCFMAGARLAQDDKAAPHDARGEPVMSGISQCWQTAFGPAPLSGCQAGQ